MEERECMKTTKIPEVSCPTCGYKMDGATSYEGRTPHPDSVSICIQCTTPSMFDESLQLRNLTEEETEALNNDPEFIRLQQAIAAVNRMTRKGNA